MASAVDTPPRSRETVSAALIEASVELFADRLPDQVTGRDIAAQANRRMCVVSCRWHQFAKSGFKRDPAELWAKQWRQIMEGVIA